MRWGVPAINMLTPPTQTVEFVGVGQELVAVAFDDVLLEALDARLLELDDLAALHAHQVVMVRFGKGHFVVGWTVAEVMLLHDPGLVEQRECAVHRPARHRGVDDAHVLDKLLGGEGQEVDCPADDETPLIGQPNPLRFQELFHFHEPLHLLFETESHV